MKYIWLLFPLIVFAETPGHWVSSKAIDTNSARGIYTYKSYCEKVTKNTCENLERSPGVVLKLKYVSRFEGGLINSQAKIDAIAADASADIVARDVYLAKKVIRDAAKERLPSHNCGGFGSGPMADWAKDKCLADQ